MAAPVIEAQSLTERVASRVHELTYGRIRDLAVEEVHGQVVVRGMAPSHHVRQLALEGALEILSSDRCRPLITVG